MERIYSIGRRPSATNGVTAKAPIVTNLSQSPTEELRDIWVDLQYHSKHDCNRECEQKPEESGHTAAAKEFAEEPWEHSRDLTNTYLGLRYSARTQFKEKVSKEAEKRIQKEDDRIQKLRVRFAPCNNEKNNKRKELMESLKTTRQEWKKEANLDAEQCLKKWVRGREGDLALLQRVKRWDTRDQCVDADIEEAKEPEPLYGFKAGAIHFKKVPGSGYVGYDSKHKKYRGEFPHQKISLHDLLEEDKDNPLSATCEPGALRYFHLPSNNMSWIEKAMAKYYSEAVADHNQYKKPKDMTKAEKLLSREFWRGQLHEGGIGKGPIHARHMRSRCSLIPTNTQSATLTRNRSDAAVPTLSSVDESCEETPKRVQPDTVSTRDHMPKMKDFAIFVPYLHWETDSRRARMAEIVKEETDIIKGETAVPDKAPKEKMDIPRLWWTTRPQQKPAETHKSKLGEYLMIVAKVADAMDYEADERLLRENLHRDPPLHIRRTLDQSYFLTLEDTGARDKDQVVYRETRQGKSHYARNTRVVMVDQLWLWILGGNTIITSFPRRWGRNKPDPSGVHKSLRERLVHTPDGGIKSIYDLALIIIDQCSSVFFDRTKPLDQRPEVMDLFASAIGNVTEHKAIAFESFWRNLAIRSLYPHDYNFVQSSQKYLEINPEGALLREAQDITEELGIMARIYSQQMTVVKDFKNALRHMKGESKNEPDMLRNILKALEAQKRPNSGFSTTERESLVPESTIQEANDLLELLRTRQREIEELEDAAVRTSEQLQALLTLKQQQASIVEAKAALMRADESAKQGRAIMLFTIVTIFFLPLGFFTAFFGMNNKEINGDSSIMHVGDQIKWMFSLSAAVIIIALSIAFIPWTRAVLLILVQVPLSFFIEYSGLRAVWNHFVADHAALDQRGRRKLDRIYNRQERKVQRRREQKKTQSNLPAGNWLTTQRNWGAPDIENQVSYEE